MSQQLPGGCLMRVLRVSWGLPGGFLGASWRLTGWFLGRASHEKQGGTNLRFFCKIRLNQTERKLWTSNDVTAQELPGGSLVRFLGAS